jgi:hypothetical protein
MVEIDAHHPAPKGQLVLDRQPPAHTIEIVHPPRRKNGINPERLVDRLNHALASYEVQQDVRIGNGTSARGLGEHSKDI